MKNLTSANRRVVFKTVVATLVMFGFGFALVPLYSLVCQAFGINGQTQRITETTLQQMPVDKTRTITVKLDANTNSRLPWRFEAKQREVTVHPGEMTRIAYQALNLSGSDITGQAIYSVTPIEAAMYFKKTDCFCFKRQLLKSGEEKDMPVVFVVDKDLPAGIKNIVLSYTFLRADKYASNDEATKN